jgi:hypothetical protein
MRRVHVVALLTAAIVMTTAPVDAQTPPTLDAIARRLEQLDQQNAALRAEVQALRREVERLTQPEPDATSTTGRLDALDEQINLQAGRLGEQEQIKAQSAQRVPIRFTGALLFSLFRNSEHGVPSGVDYPLAARTDSAPAAWAATLRRSIIGLEFNTPEAILGGQFRGSVFTDLTEGGDLLTNIQPRLRTATIEGRWNRFAIMAGQDKAIFFVRDPTSLAQVQFAPLTGAGTFWLYRPQIRFEVSMADSPRNGRAPEIISKRIAPRLKISDRRSAGCPRTCSGDM